MQFLRTAQVGPLQYWIWHFHEPDGGEEAYVTVAVGEAGEQIIGYDANDYGLTPEQYMLGDFHNVF